MADTRFNNLGDEIMMTRSEAINWIADLFEESPDDITPESKKDDIIGWDSLGVLNLMAGFDEKFEILLTDDELQELKSVNDILAILIKNGKLSD
jgi:acyl carrier protein